MRHAFLIASLFFSCTALAANSLPKQTPYYLWWEAESPVETDFSDIGEFDPKTPAEAAKLSNGRWLNVGGKHAKHFAHYAINLEKTTHYQLYARKFWYHGAFRYRFNEEPWVEIRRNNHPLLLDSVSIKPYVGVNWVNLGKHFLPAGKHRFSIELLDTQGAAAFDSFVLSEEAFTPLGLRKPGEKLVIQSDTQWSFEPSIDPFDNNSLWDLRSLNEPIAGINGYIQRDSTGNDFILGNGKPVRFWAMNTNVQHSPKMALIDYHARHLAKRGFNMVRFHGHIESKTDKLLAADTTQIEYSWRLVAAMKKQGIYTTLSPYWGSYAKAHPQWKNLNGNRSGNLAGLLFFEPTLQKAYKAWLKQWLTTPNPYTNIPLAKDPAVALLQIQNEDSLLFWSFNSIQGEHLNRLEKRYSQWLLTRYKTLEQLKKKWGAFNEDRDNIQGPHFSLLPIQRLSENKKGNRKPRLDDQYTFLIDVMQSWNQEIEDYLRHDIGYQGLINAGNWRTANNQTMLDGERLSYTPNQVMAANRYYDGGKHINPNNRYHAGHRLNVGDFYEGQSILFHPHKLPVNIKQVHGYPMIVSESTWSNPNPYQTEAPFLIAAYSSLTGIDGYYWFSAGNALSFDKQLAKFPAASPDLMLTYPAAALMYRRYYVAQASPSVEEYRSLKTIYQRKKPVISEDVGFDPNRDNIFASLSKSETPIEKNRLFLKGPVISHYGKEKNDALPFAIEHNHEGPEESSIISNTGEINWDYQRGINTVNTPKAQGATGFLNTRELISLDALTISGNTPYGSILLVSLDGENILHSKKLLLQITTQSRPNGYRTRTSLFKDIYNQKDNNTYNGYLIEDLGEMPYMINKHQLTLAITTTNINTITATDNNGYPLSKINFTKTTEGIKLTPPADATYLILAE